MLGYQTRIYRGFDTLGPASFTEIAIESDLLMANGNPPSGWDLHLAGALNSADNPNSGCYRWLSHCTFRSHSHGTHPLGEVQSGAIAF